MHLGGGGIWEIKFVSGEYTRKNTMLFFLSYEVFVYSIYMMTFPHTRADSR